MPSSEIFRARMVTSEIFQARMVTSEIFQARMVPSEFFYVGCGEREWNVPRPQWHTPFTPFLPPFPQKLFFSWHGTTWYVRGLIGWAMWVQKVYTASYTTFFWNQKWTASCQKFFSQKTNGYSCKTFWTLTETFYRYHRTPPHVAPEPTQVHRNFLQEVHANITVVFHRYHRKGVAECPKRWLLVRQNDFYKISKKNSGEGGFRKFLPVY